MKVSKYVNLFEMARADLEGVVEVVKAGDYDKAADMYISKAKSRGLDAKKVVVGLGSTFRNYAEMDSEAVSKLKEKIKEKLGGELPAKKAPAKKKEATSDAEKHMESAKIKASVAKKKAELIKAKKAEEPPKELEAPKVNESTKVSKKASLRDEILYRSGVMPEGTYRQGRIVEAMGSEGDQTSKKGGKKKVAKKTSEGDSDADDKEEAFIDVKKAKKSQKKED
jgi:hypothetical protein